MTELNYPELSPQQAKRLLGQEIGTQFNTQDRMFQYWDNGSVLDMGTWMHSDMKEMLKRDGQAAALELRCRTHSSNPPSRLGYHAS